MTIHELIESERNYVKSLQKFPNVSILCLQEMWIPIIQKYFENPFVIVANVLEILKLSMEIIDNFKNNEPLQIYLDYLDYFRIYSVYIINYSNALDRLSKSSIAREISLVELQLDLLKPIQRIPQLKLFFEKIARKVNDHRGKLVLEKVLIVASYINQTISDRELFVKWVNLESQLLGYPGHLCKSFLFFMFIVKPGRYLVKIGKVSKRNTRGNREYPSSTRILILLNDVLIYAR